MSKKIQRPEQKPIKRKFPEILLGLVCDLLEHQVPNKGQPEKLSSEEVNPYHLDPEQFSVDDIKRMMDKYHKKGLTIKDLQKKIRKANQKNRQFHEQIKEQKKRIAELENLLQSRSV